MAAIFSASDVVDLMGPIPVPDARMNLILEALETAISNQVVLLTQQTRTEYPDPDPRGGPILLLEHFVASIVDVWEQWDARAGTADQAFGDDSKLEVGADYFKEPSMEVAIRRINAGAWSKVPGSIKVTYVAGQWSTKADIPADLRMAILESAWHIAADLQKTGIFSSETVGKWSYAIASGTASSAKSAFAAPARIINSYRRMR